MSDRIIDIADKPVRLHTQLEQLVLDTDNNEKRLSIPLDDVAVLVISHPQASFTHSALSKLSSRNGTLIVCDEKHQPVGMLMPLQGHHLQCERFITQANVKEPKRKRLWQQIVKAKIKAQSILIKRMRGSDYGLKKLVERVRSGDPENIEAAASRRYWKYLFGDNRFRRDRTRNDYNIHLNYGYAVLRAITSRAVCAAGLHPALGLHHHNRYDSFPLASDLMEPFRVIVDKAVVLYSEKDVNHSPEFDKAAKEFILSAFSKHLKIDGEWKTIFNTIARTASSLSQVFMGQRNNLLLPKIYLED